jgi:hypothetical protein
MKKIFFVFIGLLGLSIMAQAQDYNACLTKVHSEWGTKCEKCVIYDGYKRDFSDTYKVYLKNTCDEAIEAMCCVQEEDKTWKCSPIRVLQPNDTISHYACKATGKYIYFAKKKGDTSVEFPSVKEVNEQFKD